MGADAVGGIVGLGQVSLHIRDTDRATRFFEQSLGLRHLYTYGDLVFFDCAGVRLYLQRTTEEKWRPGSILYFRVADIDARYAELLEQGIAFESPPHLIHRHDSGVEEWMAFFSDGEGNTLALMAEVGAAA